MRQTLILIVVAALTATLVFVNSGNRSSRALDATDASATRVNTASTTSTTAAASDTTNAATVESTRPTVYTEDFPDPFVLTTSSGYIAFSTNSRA
jgi:hypothetical protein